jgi:hypothetical protein
MIAESEKRILTRHSKPMELNGMTLVGARNLFNELLDKYGEDVGLITSNDGYSEYILVEYQELESDSEFTHRQQENLAWLKRQQKEYERLGAMLGHLVLPPGK